MSLFLIDMLRLGLILYAQTLLRLLPIFCVRQVSGRRLRCKSPYPNLDLIQEPEHTAHL